MKPRHGRKSNEIRDLYRIDPLSRNAMARDKTPLRISFNHGVEGSSPSALTTKPPTNKDLLNFPSHDPSRKFRVGRVWEGVGLSRCTLSPPFLTIDAGTNLRSL